VSRSVLSTNLAEHVMPVGWRLTSAMRLSALAMGSAMRVTPNSVVRPLASRALTAQPMLRSPVATSGLPHIRLMCGEPDRTVVGTCSERITAALEPAELEIKGAYDDPNGSHITIYCVSEKFEGKRSLARQQMVNKAIFDVFQPAGPLHAVDTMILKAPSEL